MAASTQHLGEYIGPIIVGTSIGVAPVGATSQSIVYCPFKRGVGRSHGFPIMLNQTHIHLYS